MTIALYGWGSMFNLPSPSPFIMKSDIQMQMFNLTFERKIADLDSVSKHKAPYVMDGDVLVQDSTFIRWHFETKLGIDLDKGLSPEQRAHAWTLERMLEHRLLQFEICERWLVDENFDKGPRLFFQSVPEAIRDKVISERRADIAKTMYGAGFSRFSRAERIELARADIAAAAAVLGKQNYFFGEQPTAVDAICFSVLASCHSDYFDSQMRALISKHTNLTDYIARMQERFFPEDRWPKMEK